MRNNISTQVELGLGSPCLHVCQLCHQRGGRYYFCVQVESRDTNHSLRKVDGRRMCWWQLTMTMEAKKLAHYFSLLEIISLIIGGSIMACYLLNRSLLILICITLGWLLVIFFENMALSFNSHCFLVILGLLRIFIMTGFCIGKTLRRKPKNFRTSSR